MKKLIITTQAEYNAIPDDFEGEIHITGIVENVNRAFKNAYYYVSENAQISYVSGNAQISNEVLQILDVLLCSVINVEILDREGIEDAKLISSHFGLRGVIEKLKFLSEA